MQKLGGQIKSIIVFSEVAYTTIKMIKIARLLYFRFE